MKPWIQIAFICQFVLIQDVVGTFVYRRTPFMPRLDSFALKANPDESQTSSYKDFDPSSKGIVSSLTGLVNFFVKKDTKQIKDISERTNSPPATPAELLTRIADDYQVNNYLWTGNIYTPAFEKDCRFTDPTLSFVGLDKFVSNVKNLRPIVDLLIEENGCRSELLQIDLNEEEGYVQSRWNMVGNLTALPWKPKVDVIGRTKFHYKKVEENGETGVRVYFYDECWEIPASRALLQLVTPAGTISNKPEK